jgi:hypothetical protein
MWNRGSTRHKSIGGKIDDILQAEDPRRGSIHSEATETVNEADRNWKARAELFSLLKATPNWRNVLGDVMSKSLTDKEILAELGRADSPRIKFKDAGCDITTAARCVQLLPLALAAVEPEQPHWQRMFGVRMKIAVFLLTVSAGLFATATCLLFFEKAGWTTGTCSMQNFWNATLEQQCIGLCVFDISVRSEDKMMVMQKWAPERLRDDTGAAGKVVFVGESFRCCDMNSTLDCCGFMDAVTMRFCDNWPHRADAAGNTCPSGNWPCLFKTDPDDEKIIEELIIDFEQQMMMNMFFAASGFLISGVAFVLGRHICRVLHFCSSVCWGLVPRAWKETVVPEPYAEKDNVFDKMKRKMTFGGARRQSTTSTIEVSEPAKKETKQKDKSKKLEVQTRLVQPARALTEHASERDNTSDEQGRSTMVRVSVEEHIDHTTAQSLREASAQAQLHQEAIRLHHEARDVPSSASSRRQATPGSASSSGPKEGSLREMRPAPGSASSRPRSRPGASIGELAHRFQTAGYTMDTWLRPIVTPYEQHRPHRGHHAPRPGRMHGGVGEGAPHSLDISPPHRSRVGNASKSPAGRHFSDSPGQRQASHRVRAALEHAEGHSEGKARDTSPHRFRNVPFGQSPKAAAQEAWPESPLGSWPSGCPALPTPCHINMHHDSFLES